MLFRPQSIAHPSTTATIDLLSARNEQIEHVRLRHQELVEVELLEDLFA